MGFFSSITKPFKKAFDWVGDNVGDALGFVGDVAGGLMGMSSSNKATAANSAYNDANLALAQASLAFQQQYTKERLQWAKEDAQKAGFHPMVAAGLSPTSFSPVQASFTPAVAQDFDWVGKAGQNLSYAATKAKTNKQQAEMWNYTIGSAQQQLKSLQLDNTLKELEIASMGARLKQQVGGPAAPDLNGGRNLVGGQNDSPFYISPSEIKASSSTGTQAGIPPSVQWYQNPDGSVTRSMSEQAKQANEDDIINTVLWHYDNNVVPLFLRYGGQSDSGINPADYAPPLRLLPKGAKGWLPSGYNKFIPVYKWDVPGAFYGE